MRIRSLLSIIGLSVAIPAFGQVDQYHQFFFETAVGSVKILQFSAANPANGKLTMTFTGTVLLSDYVGAPPVITGKIIKQYENKARKKVSYFGTGTLAIDGKWGSFQWFGRDMKGQLFGSAVCRLYGEYDRNGETGWAHYGGPGERQPWYQGGRDFEVPLPEPMRKVIPKVRGGG